MAITSLNTRTNQFNIIISLKDMPLDFDNRLNRFVNEAIICNYAYILHDSDIFDNGELKTKHLHLIIWNCSERYRFSSMINKLSEYLHINPLAISIDKIVSLEGSIQYLVHKNDIDKYQYDHKYINTNITCEELDLFLSARNVALTFDRLYVIIKNSKSLTDVMKELGLSIYRSYRSVIVDIWKDTKI